MYIAYFEFLLFNVLYSVGNIYWRTFLRGLLLLVFPIIRTVAKEFLLPFNLTQAVPETQNT